MSPPTAQLRRLIDSGVRLTYATSPLTTARRRREPASACSTRAPRPAGRTRPGARRWEAVLLGLLLAVVLLAPLPLGSNRPLPASALAAAVGVLLCMWGVGLLVAQARATVPLRPFWPALVLFSLAAAWAAVQAVPFTPAWLHHPYWSEAREVLGAPDAGAVSVNPGATWNRLMGLLAYGGIFWLALHLSSARARQVLFALAAGGLLYAAYGLFDFFGSNAGIVTSTFVNRNSYATYAGMTMFCGLGLVLHELTAQARHRASLRRLAVDALARLDAILAIGVITCLVAGTALLLTQSRGAFVALCAALVAFVWASRRMAFVSSRAFLKATAVCSVGLVFGIVGLAGEATLGRFTDAEVHALNRLAYYRTTWEAIWDRPLLGTGYGTYADAFRAYNHPGTGTYLLDKAHNTYLQIIMELGWPAAAALYSGLALLVFRCLQGRLQHGRRAVYPAVLASCSVLVAVHSLVDFSLEMPANAATYALLLGLGCAQSLRGRGVVRLDVPISPKIE
jgi:O-antigen ligase